jgi:hypothetical protein
VVETVSSALSDAVVLHERIGGAEHSDAEQRRLIEVRPALHI